MPHPRIADEILDLKKQRRAILLAHHYQEPEIQELADVVGDSLELARKAREFAGDVIAFCGVWFMAETAKVLNPDRIVVVPDREASCSLVESCPVEPVREFRRQQSRSRDRQLHQHVDRSEGRERHPLHLAQRRARSSIPFRAEKPVLFLPDRNLGNYVQAADRPREHEDLAGRLHRARHLPGAPRGGGEGWSIPAPRWWRIPECPEAVLAMADFIGSTSAIIEWCARSDAARIHRDDRERRPAIRCSKLAPGKQFYFVANENCNCSECPYMKLNTLEKLRDCLLQPGAARGTVRRD